MEESEKLATDLVFDFTKLGITLALGGMGFVIGFFPQNNLSILLCSGLSALFFLGSILYGIGLLTKSISLLRKNKFSINEKKIKYRAMLQIILFLLGFLFLAAVIVIGRGASNNLRLDIGANGTIANYTLESGTAYSVKVQGTNISVSPSSP